MMHAEAAATAAPSWAPGPRTPSVLWHVELNVVGAQQVHKWRGWAVNSEDASTRARNDARRTWPGWPLCVRSVLQVCV